MPEARRRSVRFTRSPSWEGRCMLRVVSRRSPDSGRQVSVWCFRLVRLAGVASVVACSGREPGRVIGAVDAFGRQITLEHPPERIVSLSPATTELLFDLGVGDRVVGRTRWCDYPPAVTAIP